MPYSEVRLHPECAPLRSFVRSLDHPIALNLMGKRCMSDMSENGIRRVVHTQSEVAGSRRMHGQSAMRPIHNHHAICMCCSKRNASTLDSNVIPILFPSERKCRERERVSASRAHRENISSPIQLSLPTWRYAATAEPELHLA